MTTTSIPTASAAKADGRARNDYLRSRWDDVLAAKMDPVERLIYRSNILGADARITNTGGGNTSSKIEVKDPLTGETTRVLWVKGSGGDLRTATKSNFASLYLDQVLNLRTLYEKQERRGPKTPAEDAMVGMYPHTTFDRNPTASSIDTPLHAFIPYAHVDHMHPVAVIALATAADGEALTREVYGDEVIWTDWQRPGFELGLTLERICREHPSAKGVILGGHGLINWADDDRACYELTLDLIRRAQDFLDARRNGTPDFGGARVQPLPDDRRRQLLAELLPWLRGKVSGEKRQVATVEMRDEVVAFVNSKDAERLAELGTSCPDHFLRTKIKPLYVPLSNLPLDSSDAAIDSFVSQLKEKLTAGIKKYRADYTDYYNRCKRPNSPAMRDPNPTVMLIPGLGMIAWGKDKSESRVTAEFYNCTVEVMRGAEAIDRYIALPQQEALDIEYWALEEAKLRRMPPEKELARQVAVVVGAGSGIGREVALRLVKEGAQIVCVDVKIEAAQATAKEITDKVGLGIGVAGSGISNCGPAIGLACDITNRASVRAMLEQVALAYGGFDSIIGTAGNFFSPDTTGPIPDDKWDLTFRVNVTGSYIVADEAATMWREQGLPGNLVLTTSANAVVAKKGSLAYDTSKAAANHLVRELAMELAPLIRVNGVAPATVVQGSAMFPRERVIASLAKYNIAYTEDESTDSLTRKLAQFYADRTLTKSPITPSDQAEAFFLLVSPRLSKTTGQVITVDGGLHEAFLR